MKKAGRKQSEIPPAFFMVEIAKKMLFFMHAKMEFGVK